jgi:hypothetical protein
MLTKAVVEKYRISVSLLVRRCWVLAPNTLIFRLLPQ